MTNTLQ